MAAFDVNGGRNDLYFEANKISGTIDDLHDVIASLPLSLHRYFEANKISGTISAFHMDILREVSQAALPPCAHLCKKSACICFAHRACTRTYCADLRASAL
eukprot:2003200-Pleurochrysis_carterae.AAC.2